MIFPCSGWRQRHFAVGIHQPRHSLTCRNRVRKMKRLELDFLNADSEYRTVQLRYVNLIGSYLTAASRLNFAVGQEVIP
jgi:hypothetical protein